MLLISPQTLRYMNAIVSGKAKTIETPKGPCNNYQEGEEGGGGGGGG